MSVFIPRAGTGSLKYDGVEAKFGVSYSDLISMWIADMDVAIPSPVQAIVTAQLSDDHVGYMNVPIAQTVTRWLSQQKTSIDPAWVVPCAGLVNTLYHCIALFTNPNDIVAVVSPTYSPLYAAVRDQGRRLDIASATLERGIWELDVTEINPDSRAILLCNPQNPTGHVWTPAQLSALLCYCRTHDILVICDEVHADFIFDTSFMSAISHQEADINNLIILRSVSKTFNLASIDNASYAIVADKVKRLALQRLLAQRHLEPAPLACSVLNIAYQQCDDWLAEVIAAIAINRQLIAQLAAQLPECLSLYLGQGTYFALLDARRLSDNPAETLLHDYHLALGAGDPEFAPGFFRLNLATDKNTVVKVMQRLCGYSIK